MENNDIIELCFDSNVSCKYLTNKKIRMKKKWHKTDKFKRIKL